MTSPFLKTRIVEAVRKDPTLAMRELRERFSVSADVITSALRAANVVRTPVTLISSREVNGMLKKTIRKVRSVK
jgi:hypothetical protein